MYSALDIAYYIIDSCTKKNKPVSNLKLQKMLYFIWIDYYNQKKRPLFNDAFYAWRFGPVIPEVYYEFCAYGGIPIEREYNALPIGEETSSFLANDIEKYLDIPVSELVNQTHKQYRPWYKIYIEKKQHRCEIPQQLIVKMECG